MLLCIIPLKIAQGSDNPIGSKKQFRLVMNADNNLCGYIGKVINNNAHGFGVIDYKIIPEFNAVDWSEKIVTLTAKDNYRRDKVFEIAKIDVFNDGNIETIARTGVVLSGYIGSQVFVLEGQDKNIFDNPEISVEKYTKLSGLLFSTTYPYSLSFENAKPSDMKTYFNENNFIGLSEINIFYFNKKYYFVLNQSIRIPKETPTWLIVAELKREQFEIKKYNIMANKLDYVCYFDSNQSAYK